jgi:DNA-binding beta-propeller fold protein YncE/phospholipase C
MYHLILTFLIIVIAFPHCSFAQSYRSPAGTEFARVVPGGTTILPNGRLLTPVGNRLYTDSDLWNVVLSPDGKWVVGFCKAGIVVYSSNETSPRSPSFRIPWKQPAFCGVFTKDSSKLVTSSGDAGHGIQIFETREWSTAAKERLEVRDLKPIATIRVDDEAYINDIVLTSNERFAFGADVARQRIVAFDLVANCVVADIPVGREPFSLALSADGTRLFVANIGVFDYSLVPTGDGNPRGISVPAFGFPSKEAEEGVELEGRKVPGLGDASVVDAHSVWMIDVADPSQPKVAAKVKTGILLHAPADGGKAVGGSSPNSLCISGETLFVSNGNNDTVQFFNVKTMELVRTVKLAPQPALSTLRGVIPSGMAASSDGKTLYVCASGLNAVAVIDIETGTARNWIPTGWFPNACRLSPDQSRLYIATQKGLGHGPRGSKHARQASDERFGLREMPGMIWVVDLAHLASGLDSVLHNNGMIPQKEAPRAFPAEIEHVVFITKENHTFDGIFGGLPGSTSESEYAEFGTNGWLKEKGKSERLPVMPNHIRLAHQFAISDNFYMEPQASGDGHRWLVGVYPSFWTTRVFYSGWGFKLSESAKGRLIAFGSNGSQIPEDYLENGSLWEHLSRGGVTFRNYGEGFELPDNDEGKPETRSGAFTRVNYPMPKVLYDNTCFEYPAYNTNIPDVARVDWFVEDLEKYRSTHAGKLPKFLNIAICNDHGAMPNPKTGYPYVASYMADNDLALGRIVAYLSSQPEWKKMAIFVTQDDSGGDDDMIDRHRSFVLCISPWAKHGYVSHEHTSIMSIIKSIYTLSKLGPNNLFDATATDLADMFDSKPDYTPYKYVPADPRVFKPEDTFDPTDPKFERRRLAGPAMKLDDPDFVESLRDK